MRACSAAAGLARRRISVDAAESCIAAVLAWHHVESAVETGARVYGSVVPAPACEPALPGRIPGPFPGFPSGSPWPGLPSRSASWFHPAGDVLPPDLVSGLGGRVLGAWACSRGLDADGAARGAG